MWTDKFNKSELAAIKKARNTMRELGEDHYSKETPFCNSAILIAKLADLLDEEASWNHSFRFIPQEDWVKSTGYKFEVSGNMGEPKKTKTKGWVKYIKGQGWVGAGGSDD